MTKHEQLMAEYEDSLHIEERKMKNEGLYADGFIWLKENMSSNRKACILAEELGHYETSCGNILDQDDVINRRQERRARKWAYEKIVPLEKINKAFSQGYTEVWELAEHLDVDEEFLVDALKHYGILDI